MIAIPCDGTSVIPYGGASKDGSSVASNDRDMIPYDGASVIVVAEALDLTVRRCIE